MLADLLEVGDVPHLVRLPNESARAIVITAIPDMQGRLMGKRFQAEFFLESAWEETHCCNYLIATDLEMYTVDGYASTSWSAGYGDYIMKPDPATLREHQ